MPPTPFATLFDVVLRLAREVVLVRQGTATGGTTASLTDSVSAFPIDTFRGGTLFLLNDIIFRAITQQNGGIFTWAAVVSDAPDAGDPYAVADNDIPLDVLVASINTAIRSMTIPAEDITLLTVASQEEYTIPANVGEIYKVEIAANTTSPYGFVEHFRWNQVGGKLRFAKSHKPATTDYVIRLTHRRVHTDITAEATAIPNDINLDYLHWSAVQIAAKYGARVHGTDPKRDWPAKIQESEVRIQRLASLQPKPQRSPRLSDW
jgi:hypothetical protein